MIMHDACKYGHLPAVKKLLNSGVLIDIKAASGYPGFGRTPLHIACRHGHSEVVRELLNRGADMEAVDDFTSTPLHEACTAGHLEVVRELLDRHADMEAVDKYHETPLHVACSVDHLEVIRELLDRGANIEAKGEEGYTPLLTAVINSSVQVVRLLLSRGASVNAVDSSGNTALHHACWIKNLDVVNELLDHGADVNAMAVNGDAPLMKAILGFDERFKVIYEPMTRMLIITGASVNIQGNYNFTPLHFARNVILVKALLDGGADINIRTDFGKTPLERACWSYNVDVVKLLLSRGASFSSLDHLIAEVESNKFKSACVKKRPLIMFLEDFPSKRNNPKNDTFDLPRGRSQRKESEVWIQLAWLLYAVLWVVVVYQWVTRFPAP